VKDLLEVYVLHRQVPVPEFPFHSALYPAGGHDGRAWENSTRADGIRSLLTEIMPSSAEGRPARQQHYSVNMKYAPLLFTHHSSGIAARQGMT
jgi:hypothetical protein